MHAGAHRKQRYQIPRSWSDSSCELLSVGVLGASARAGHALNHNASLWPQRKALKLSQEAKAEKC